MICDALPGCPNEAEREIEIQLRDPLTDELLGNKHEIWCQPHLKAALDELAALGITEEPP